MMAARFIFVILLSVSRPAWSFAPATVTTTHRPSKHVLMISSGFSFSDGEQILVSAQKPLGMVLEQDPETGVIVVTSLDPTGSASQGGVQIGDVLMAVQNASTEQVDLDDVLNFIGQGPRVMNLRLLRNTSSDSEE